MVEAAAGGSQETPLLGFDHEIRSTIRILVTSVDICDVNICALNAYVCEQYNEIQYYYL